MSKIITFLLFLFPVMLFGQTTKKITNKETNEVYYVLKSDGITRQGSYKKLGWKNQPLVDGFYKNGVKDSIWTFYDDNGQIAQKYDYTHKALVFEYKKNSDKHEKSKILKGADTIEVMLDQYPVYIGGNNMLYHFLADSIQYPQSARESNIKGTVQIGFVIDTNGHAVDFRVVKSVYPCLDQEALRVVKLLPNEWVPAVAKGEKVVVPFILPIRFALQ